MGRQLLRWAKRRWWALVLCLPLTLAVGVGLFMRSEPLYRSERQILFTVSPTFQDPEVEVNPFLNFVPNLNTAMEVVGITVTSQDVAERLAPPASGVTYSAGQSPLTGAPVMMVEVEAPTAKQADDVADQLSDLVSQVLREQQAKAGAPKATWVSDSLISSTAEPERVWSKQVRSAIAGMALGLMLALGLLALLLRHDLRRSRKRPRLGTQSPTPEHRVPEELPPTLLVEGTQSSADELGSSDRASDDPSDAASRRTHAIPG